LEKYFSITGTNMDDLKNQVKKNSENEVKAQLVIEAVGKEEKIEAEENEVEAKIAELAENYKKSPEELKELFKEDDYAYVKSQIIYNKTIDFLVKNAVLKK